MRTLTQLYPAYALRVVAGPLELAPVRDEDIPALVALAADGIHAPGEMPFLFPWTETPPDELGLAMARHYWRSRAENTVQTWSLELVVRRAGQIVGVQSVATEHFLVTRTGETGSWLGRRHQGQGVGTLMRQVVCELAFDHLDFEEITSGAFTDNPSSLAVSRKVGYRDNGSVRYQRRDHDLAVCQKLTLTPDDLVRSGLDLHVEGLAECRRFLGLDG